MSSIRNVVRQGSCEMPPGMHAIGLRDRSSEVNFSNLNIGYIEVTPTHNSNIIVK